MSDTTRICVHEAGHLVLALALGCKVTSAEASERGGVVHSDEPAEWSHSVILDLAGLAAEDAILGEANAYPSSDDIGRAQRKCISESGHARTLGNIREKAISLAWQYRDEIIATANELQRCGKLSQFDVAQLCWTGPLTQFSSLYKRPAALQQLEAAFKVEGAADRKAQVLRGIIIAEEGDFKDGRGAFDSEGLSQIVKMINAEADGIRSRFGHPSMFSDGIGTLLGRVKNAKLGSVVRKGKSTAAARGDLHFNPAAAFSPVGDLISYVMKAVEADAGALSASLVIRPYEVERGRNQAPLWYPEAIAGLDLVDVGAATGSLLAAG